MINIQNISKSFSELKAIDTISFSIEPGCLCGLVGPNGAGKSTLFKMIIGLLEPDGGSIQIAGNEIYFGETKYKSQIGFAPETPQLYEYLTGVEFLQFICVAKKVAESEQEIEINEWLDFFSLREKANELIRNYSQGMRKKISLCAALIGKPAILFLDEATNGLDPESSFKFKEYLRSYCNHNNTVLFSSHIIETVEHLCDRIIILHRGKIKQELRKKEWENLRGEGSSLEQLFIQLVQN